MIAEVKMLLRASVLAAIAAAMLASSQNAEAGSRKRSVSPVFVPPDHVYLAPIGMPLDGAFLTSRPPHCPHRTSADGRTMYYFNGRWADRPDVFYIVRD